MDKDSSSELAPFDSDRLGSLGQLKESIILSEIKLPIMTEVTLTLQIRTVVTFPSNVICRFVDWHYIIR